MGETTMKNHIVTVPTVVAISVDDLDAIGGGFVYDGAVDPETGAAKDPEDLKEKSEAYDDMSESVSGGGVKPVGDR
jgi:hypothetical protein